MHKILLLLFITLLNLYGGENIWSQDTKGMGISNSQQVIDAYITGGDVENLTFKDDPEVKRRKLSIVDNIFMLGLSIGGNSAEDTIKNTTGSKSLTNTAYEGKFTIGKDFTFFHERYTQPTRLYLAINYSLQGEADVYGWSLGIRENMSYWDFYKTPTYSIYPTLSFELGSSTMKRDDISISAFTMEGNLGLTYKYRDNFEYFFNFKVASNNWDYASAGKTFEGVDYETFYLGLLIGLNYKFNYGDF